MAKQANAPIYNECFFGIEGWKRYLRLKGIHYIITCKLFNQHTLNGGKANDFKHLFLGNEYPIRDFSKGTTHNHSERRKQ